MSAPRVFRVCSSNPAWTVVFFSGRRADAGGAVHGPPGGRRANVSLLEEGDRDPSFPRLEFGFFFDRRLSVEYH